MKKSELMKYKNYYGSVLFNYEEKIFYGKIEFIKDLINYEAHDADSLIKSFQEAVDDYLNDCKVMDREPNISFKGNFNIRISPSLHRDATLYAIEHGDTLNNVINQAINSFIKTVNK